MGGKLSGMWRRKDAKRLVEETLHIDAGRWRRERVIAPNAHRSGVYSWHRGDDRIAAVRYETECGATEGAATLAYRRGEQRIMQRIALTTIPSNLKIGRWWLFVCPQCERRAKRLYLADTEFMCRRCADLAYRSQREWHIPERLARRIAPRLGHSVEELSDALRCLDKRMLRLMNIVL